MEYTRRQSKTVVPLPPITMMHTVCAILDGLLPKVRHAVLDAPGQLGQRGQRPLQELPKGAPPPDRKLVEHHMAFACIWAFGGCAAVSKVRIGCANVTCSQACTDEQRPPQV